MIYLFFITQLIKQSQNCLDSFAYIYFVDVVFFLSESCARMPSFLEKTTINTH